MKLSAFPSVKRNTSATTGWPIIHLNSLQFGDDPPIPFSFLNDQVWISPEEQLQCHLTYTNERAHKIVAENMHVNRHVREEINGPRYKECLFETQIELKNFLGCVT